MNKGVQIIWGHN